MEIPCSICGNVAVVITQEQSGIFINSALRRFSLHSSSPEVISALLQDLKEGKFQKVHQALLKVSNGLDYYCPDCDRFYCADHYEVIPQFEEGWYDFSMATCPYGHRRIMDD